MEGLAEVTLSTIVIFGKEIQYNPIVFKMTWFIIFCLVGVALFVRSNMSLIPGKVQSFFEIIYDFLKEITLGTLGEEDGRKHLPFIVTLFVFILASNWIGILPNLFSIFGMVLSVFHAVVGSPEFVVNGLFDIKVQFSSAPWYYFLDGLGGFEEPTRSINTDLALGLLVFVAVNAYGIKNKGVVGFLRNFLMTHFQ